MPGELGLKSIDSASPHARIRFSDNRKRASIRVDSDGNSVNRQGFLKFILSA